MRRVAFSTWFRTAELGMTEFEVLSRSSLFAVARQREDYHSKLHLVVPAHVAAPWRFPNYYAADWLQAVDESHVRFNLDVWEGGELAARHEVEPVLFWDGELDVGLVHLADEEAVLPALGPALRPLELAPVPEPGAALELEFSGLQVEESGDDWRMTPLDGHGHVSAVASGRFFVRTDPVMPDGMCGTGALLPDGRCVGMLEGIVPPALAETSPDEAVRAVAGHSAIVDSAVLTKLIDSVEVGSVEPFQ